jgi:hypothetical protein
VGARHALFPGCRHLALVSFRRSPAADFPTPISLQGEFRPLSRAAPAIPRRGLLGEASSPRRRSLARDPLRHIAAARLRIHQAAAFIPRSAIPGRDALASSYGSGLLPRRLPSFHSQAIRFSVRLQQEVLSAPAGAHPLPVSALPLRVPIATRDLPVRSAHQERFHVPVSSSNQNLAVTGFLHPAETVALPG